MKKALVIFPGIVYPTMSGSTARVSQITSYLGKMGYIVDLATDLQYNQASEKKQSYFAPSFVRVLPVVKISNIFEHISCRFDGIKSIIKTYLYNFTKNKFFLNETIDERFPLEWKRFLKTQSVEKYDVVVVNYVFMSKAFTYFPNSKKILDTHDNFINRNEQYFKACTWHSLSKKEQSKGFNRADTIIAIQEIEKKLFSKQTTKEVLEIGYSTKMNILSRKNVSKKRLVFVGSDNDANVKGVVNFVKTILPKLDKSFSVHIYGTVCNRLQKFAIINQSTRVTLQYYVSNLKNIYSQASLILAPNRFGTGQNVKVLEAVYFGVPVIGTKHIEERLPKSLKGFYSYSNPNECVELIHKHSKNPYLSKGDILSLKDLEKKHFLALKKVMSD